MINQGIVGADTGLSAPVALPDPIVTPVASPAMRARLDKAVAAPLPHVLAAEHVGTLTVALPRVSARQRAAMLAYAVEDRVAAPIDATLVTPGPGGPGPDGVQLVLAVARAVLEDCPDDAPRVLPEILLIPRPQTGWAVWCEDDRCLVRAADGTGFAAASGMLPLLWERSGTPQVELLAGRLPGAIPHRDRTDAPPPPDPKEVAFGLPRNRARDRARHWRPLRRVAALAAIGLTAHLLILAADVAALGRIADAARATAQAAIAEPLPGIAMTTDVAPILARLTPVPRALQGSDLLPLLSEVSRALADTDADATFRRLAWGAAEGELVALVQATGLEALQRIETGLVARGFDVRPGIASATDDGAEAEMRIARGGA